MKTVIISDIHVTEKVKHEAYEKLDETVSEINSEDPDLVIVLGDMIGGQVTTGKTTDEENEGIEEIDKVREKIEKIDAHSIYLLGNHEQDIDKKKFSEKFDQETYGLKQVKEENFIYMDSSAPELSGSRGQISQEQLDFLDEKLEELEQAFIVIHHPIHFRDLSHSYYWDVYPERALCGNKKEINNVIEKHGNVKAVFNSHIHDLDLTKFKGLNHYTNPPFISESREEGFNQYYTVLDVADDVEATVIKEDTEVKKFSF